VKEMAIKYEPNISIQPLASRLVSLLRLISKAKKKNANSRKVMEEIKKRKRKEIDDYLFLSRYGGL
jgi:hypothetical protein